MMMKLKRFLPFQAPLATALLGIAALGAGPFGTSAAAGVLQEGTVSTPHDSGTKASPIRFAQAGQQARARGHEREVSDQEHAKWRRESGENRSFEELFGRASAIGRGEYLGVEPDVSRNVYRFKFMRPGGNVVWVDMDGRTGRVIAARQ